MHDCYHHVHVTRRERRRPFGGRVRAERCFGDVVLPSAVTVGWWFATPRFKPFFEATIEDVAVIRGTQSSPRSNA